MLLVAALSMLAALGAMSAQGQPSLLRLEVAAVMATLAPLLWPGTGARSEGTATRVVGWSLAATTLAAAVIVAIAGFAQPALPVFLLCAMLLAILIIVHAAIAFVEHRWRQGWGDADGARELAGRAVALAFVIVSTLPFWFGPIAQVVSVRHPRVIDLAVALSPITHLAVASGSDVLRATWFYEHSNLSALRVSTPEPAELAWSYGSACAALAIYAIARRRRRFVAGPAPQ
ncbi:MAG: hypothetical protein ABI745_02760 [Caldimonas sp.]